MKNSRILLGVTAFALAIAGALSTKASNKLVNQTGYTINDCTAKTHKVITSCIVTGTHAVCTTTGGGTLYTNACVKVLRRAN